MHLRSGFPFFRLMFLAAILAASSSVAADAVPSSKRALPLGADWARERGIELPNPFGASLFIVYMSRDFEVDDVRVTLPGDEPVSISDIASFAVRNETTLAALKLDAWILPILNVYALAGHTWTETGLDVTVTIDRRIGDPIVIEVTEDSAVGGPLLGCGMTVVAGSGPWFVMADANFNYSDIDAFDNGIAAWFLSARTGWSGDLHDGVWRAWVGAAYLAADRTVSSSAEVAELGTVVIDIDQRPSNPMTAQAGGSLGFGKRWEAMLEAGSNFDDAFVGVFSAAYRF